VTDFIEKQFAGTEVTVNYAEGPDNGPPLVFIHGLGGRWVNWQQVMTEMVDTWHVYAVDLRGHGDSGRVTDKYQFDHYPDDVIEFLREVVGIPAFLMGHSLGGVTAVGVASRVPDSILGLVLEDPPLYIHEWFVESDFAPIFESILEIRNRNLSVRETAIELRKLDTKSSDEAIEMRAVSVTKADPGVWEAALNRSLQSNWNPDELLPTISAPTLLMQANPDRGSALLDSEATRATDLIPGGRYVRWDDSGHGMHNEHPERFIQLVSAFLRQVRRKLS